MSIHYVHAKSGRPGRGIPLMLIHGWPGSWFEFHRCFEPLTGEYTSKCGAPFVLAARTASKAVILGAFARRVHNLPLAEVDEANERRALACEATLRCRLSPPHVARFVGLSQRILTVRTAAWLTTAKGTNLHPHWGVKRMDVQVKTRSRAALRPVAPHGLAGQTFDGDRLPLDGRRDDYTKATSGKLEHTTRAAGESEPPTPALPSAGCSVSYSVRAAHAKTSGKPETATTARRV